MGSSCGGTKGYHYSISRSFFWLELLGLMSSSLTAPHGYTIVVAGTVVSVHALNGQILISWTCGVDQELWLASWVLFATIGKKLQVPRNSVHLVWGNVIVVDDPCQTMPATSHSPAIGGGLMVSVSYTISTVDLTMIEWVEEWPVCCCCGDPCDDVSDSGDGTQANCIDCDTCRLCPACHIQLPDGSWHCIACLEEFDGLDIASRRQRRFLKRFELLDPGRLHAMRAIFHWKKFWFAFAKGRV